LATQLHEEEPVVEAVEGPLRGKPGAASDQLAPEISLVSVAFEACEGESGVRPVVRGALPGALLTGAVQAEFERVTRHTQLVTGRDLASYSLAYPPLPSPAAARALARPLLARLHGRPIPYWATLSLTDAARTRSNLRGIQGSSRPDLERELSTAEWKRIIDQVLDLGVSNISLRGGEALLREDVVELVEYIDTDRVTVNLYTDGSCLEPSVLPRLEAAGLRALVFQLQGSTPDLHDEAAQLPGLYEKVVRGVGQALDADLLVGFITNSKKEDISSGELEARIRLARTLGLHQITTVDAIPTISPSASATRTSD